MLAWFRKLVAAKFDGSEKRSRPTGRPVTVPVIEELVLRFAEENPCWGCDRIVGALENLGHQVTDRTVASILRRNGLPPAGRRKPTVSWADFIASHQDVLAAGDFFTQEVLTKAGLVTYFGLFFMKIGTREVKVAGITQHPNAAWMKQIARNLTFSEEGFLSRCRYLILDRDAKFTESFRGCLEQAGVEIIRLPARSPNLNAYAERWILSLKSECLSKLVLFGEEELRRAVDEYIRHYHAERNHQGKGNVILFPGAEIDAENPAVLVECHRRLGGLLKY